MNVHEQEEYSVRGRLIQQRNSLVNLHLRLWATGQQKPHSFVKVWLRIISSFPICNHLNMKTSVKASPTTVKLLGAFRTRLVLKCSES